MTLTATKRTAFWVTPYSFGGRMLCGTGFRILQEAGCIFPKTGKDCFWAGITFYSSKPIRGTAKRVTLEFSNGLNLLDDNYLTTNESNLLKNIPNGELWMQVQRL